MEKLRFALRILLPVVFIAVGVGVARKLIDARPKVGRKAPVQQGALVVASPVTPVDRRVTVRAQGEVMAARALTLQPQVAGQVLVVHPGLEVGGRVPAGAELLRIEDVDYRLAVAQAQTQLEQAKQALALEKGRRAVAEREWGLMPEARRKAADGETRARALRAPQLAQAEAQVAAAEAAVRQARLNVGRAKITAPFNALVLQETVEVGQVVGPGAQIARLVGTDAFWIQVSLPQADLKWLRFPTDGARGSAVQVRLDTGDGVVERAGHVLRLQGELDPVGRLARIVVQVDDPLGLETPEPPLLLGSFVEVLIDGEPLKGVVEVPRLALREGDQVWLFADGKLAMRSVQVARRLRDSVLVAEGLAPGEQLIVSRLATPVPGMPLRLKGAAPAPATAEAATADGARPAPREVAR